MTSITSETSRLLAAERRFGSHGETMTEEETAEIAAGLSDETWLAAVAAILSEYTTDLDEAIGSIEANREKCLVARGMGFEVWEMARHAAEQMGLR